jgi:hypothetical protein
VRVEIPIVAAEKHAKFPSKKSMLSMPQNGAYFGPSK